MKTSEFVEKVEALPFVEEVYRQSETLMVKGRDSILAKAGTKYKWSGLRVTGAGRHLSENELDSLMHLVWQYISTPVDEREPEKRYVYKLPSDFDVKNVLTFSSLSEKYFFSRIKNEKYKGDTLMFQKYFTDKEVEMMPADVINVLKACVKEEAE